MTNFNLVKDFNLGFGHAVRNKISLDYPDVKMRYEEVFLEEVEEIAEAFDLWSEAVTDEERKEAATLMLDALCDTEVTLHGLAQAMGMPTEEGMLAVHRSNMSKLGVDGKPVYYPEGHQKAGKIAKGPNFKDPHDDLRQLVEENWKTEKN